MSSQKYDYLFKIVIFVRSDEEKNEFLSKFFDCPSSDNQLTKIGFEIRTKLINFENKSIKLQLINTAHQERINIISKMDHKGANGIILMYDVTDKNSFEKIKNWIKQLNATADKSVTKILVGNKCDAPERVVTEEEGKKLAEEFGFGFLETSSTNNKNINEVFYYLVKAILKLKEGV